MGFWSGPLGGMGHLGVDYVTKGGSNLTVLLASVLREEISNITLTVGESGTWISKNRILNRVVATLPANKIWHFRIQDTRFPCSLPIVLYYLSILVASVCIYKTKSYPYLA